MYKIRGMVFGYIGFALVGLGAGFIVYHRMKERPPALVSSLPEEMTSDVSLNHIEHVTTRDGAKELVLRAESAEYQRAENKTVLKDISATFFLKEGGDMHLVSKHGKLMTDTQDFEVSGDVVIQSGTYALNTEKIFYDHKNGRISADSKILIKGNGLDLVGESMVYSLDTKRVLIRGGVEAVFRGWNLF